MLACNNSKAMMSFDISWVSNDRLIERLNGIDGGGFGLCGVAGEGIGGGGGGESDSGDEMAAPIHAVNSALRNPFGALQQNAEGELTVGLK